MSTPPKAYVANESSINKVEDRFWPIIEQVRASYVDCFGKALQSVYLEGSVGRGEYIDGSSDLDTKAIVSRKITSKELDCLEIKRQAIRSSNPWLPKLDLAANAQEDLKADARKQFILATDGVVLMGEPFKFTAKFPPIGPELARLLYGGFYRTQLRAQGYLNNGFTDMELRYGSRVRWLAKQGLRLAQGLLMTREPFYTRNVAAIVPKVIQELPELAETIKFLADKEAVDPAQKSTKAELQAVVDAVGRVYQMARAEGICD